MKFLVDRVGNQAWVHAQSCLTLCHSMDCSPPGFSVHGIFQARVLELGVIAFSLPNHNSTVSVKSLYKTADWYYYLAVDLTGLIKTAKCGDLIHFSYI